MTSKRVSVFNTPRRIPRKGLLFLLIRFFGLLLKIAGLLLFVFAIIVFFIQLVRIIPTIIEAIQYIDQQRMAGLILITSLTSLLVFPIIGLVGAVIAALGYAIGYLGTEPAVSTSIISPEQEQNSQLEESPTK